MEADRYEQSHGYFITGIICLILSLVFFGVDLYLLPNLLFDLHYAMPSLIVDLYGYILTTYQMTEKSALWVVFLGILTLGFIFSVIAYIASNHIDNKIHNLEAEKSMEWSARKNSAKDSGKAFLKILIIVGFVFVVSLLFQWAISSPSPTPNY